MNFKLIKQLLFGKLPPPSGVEELLESSQLIKNMSKESMRQSDILSDMIRSIKGTKPKTAPKRNRNKK